MCTIHLPDVLVDQIAAAGVPAGAMDEFVQQAVREKLAAQEVRVAHVVQAIEGFDAIYDASIISSADTRLTRDQLHERD